MSNAPSAFAVQSAEKRLLDAQLKGDRAALSELLSDNFVGTNPDGSRVNKAQEIENLVESRYTSGELTEVSVQSFGGTSIAVGKLVMKAGAISHRFYFTDVYVGDKLVACQATLA